MGIEFHMAAKDYGDNKKIYQNIEKTVKAWKKLGFHLASYSPNMIHDKNLELDQKYHSYFDVLFVRTSERSVVMND